MFQVKRSLVWAVAVGLSVSSPAVMLDDFTVGPFATSFQGLGTSGAASQLLVSSIPDERSLVWGVLADPLSVMPARLSVGSGSLELSTVPMQVVRLDLGYGANRDLNLNWSGLDRLRVDVKRSDLGLRVRAWATGGGHFSETGWTTFHGTGDLDFLFSSFTHGSPVAWNDVDRFGLRFETAPAGDFALNSVEAVPEPASLAALGLGTLALWRRRKQR